MRTRVRTSTLYRSWNRLGQYQYCPIDTISMTRMTLRLVVNRLIRFHVDTDKTYDRFGLHVVYPGGCVSSQHGRQHSMMLTNTSIFYRIKKLE